MSNEEIIKLLLQIRGQTEAKETREEIDKLAASLKNADAAGKKAGDGVAEGAEKASKNVGNLGLSASRFAQDFAQGFGVNGVQGALVATGNNLEALTMALGFTGLGDAIATVAYTALPLLTSALSAAFNLEPVVIFTDRVDELKAKIKQLEEKPIKLTVDLEAIEKAKQELEELAKNKAALDAIMSGQSEYEAKSGKAIDQAVLNTPGGREALEAFKARSGQSAVAQSAEIKQARAAMQEALAFKGYLSADDSKQAIQRAQAAIDSAEARARETGEARAGAVLRKATKGSGYDQILAQETLAKELGGLTGQAITEARPTALEFQDFQAEQQKKKAAQDAAKAKAEKEDRDRMNAGPMGPPSEVGASQAAARAAENLQADAFAAVMGSSAIQNQAGQIVAAGGDEAEVLAMLRQQAEASGRQGQDAVAFAQAMLQSLRMIANAQRQQEAQWRALFGDLQYLQMQTQQNMGW